MTAHDLAIVIGAWIGFAAACVLLVIVAFAVWWVNRRRGDGYITRTVGGTSITLHAKAWRSLGWDDDRGPK